MKLKIQISFLLLILLFSCRNDKVYEEYETEYIIIVVIDGPRYSETWGEPNHAFIPYQSALRSEGVYLTNYNNNGWTYTVPGHAAMTTGKYENIDNSGQELPDEPSIFQVYRKEHNIPQNKTWLVCSKGKLDILSNCNNSSWKDKYRPSSNCGIGGGGVTSGYRHDSTTFQECLQVIDTHHPKLLLINFREPDYTAHQGDFPGYLSGITRTDGYVAELWDFIQNDPIYKDKTTLFITNDHGRHLDNVSSGFDGHGDGCEGCRHISLFVLGPDTKKNAVISTEYEQIDLATTIGRMLHFNAPNDKGKFIRDIFK